MTVSTTINRLQYAGNGVAVEFSFPYYFLDDADLTVILSVDATGVETTQVITTDYTVSGAGDPAGGSVTMVTAPASGETLTIIRDPATTQSLDLVDNDPQPAEELEKALDRVTMIAQRTRELAERTIGLAESDAASSLTLPAVGDRMNKFLAFNASGEPIAATTVTTSPVTAFAATLLDDVDQTEAQTTLGLSATVQDPSSGTTADDNFTTVKHKFDFTAAPTTSNDSTQGYSQGSLGWVNTTGVANSGSLYVCRDATAANAQWRKIAARIVEQATAPTVTDDRNSRYSRGALIINTGLSSIVYACADNTAGTAIWDQISNEWELFEIQAVTGSVMDWDITTGFTVGYDTRIVGRQIRPITNNQYLYYRTSTDGGSTFDAGASDYSWAAFGTGADGGTNGNSDNADTECHMHADSASGSRFYQGNDTVEAMSFDLVIQNPRGTTLHKTIKGEAHGIHTTGTESWSQRFNGCRQDPGDVDAMRFFWSGGGNFANTGQFLIYRRRIRS